ncbi:hypothetical protein TNCV_1542141 [Trichonephila clavipes]|nr:hypothetical protein TNCV_1542141 [Trichonephila clavipes]
MHKETVINSTSGQGRVVGVTTGVAENLQEVEGLMLSKSVETLMRRDVEVQRRKLQFRRWPRIIRTNDLPFSDPIPHLPTNSRSHF